MTPRPPTRPLDHPSLEDHRVVILGGTGGVGEGLVEAWLHTGAEVVVPTRTAARADELRTRLAEHPSPGRLRTIVGDYTSFDGAEEMAARITEKFGPVTDVIASLGGWWQGAPLWQVDAEDWQRVFVDLTTAHVAQVRAWIPRLAEQGSYQLILGGSAERPVPGSSLVSMEQASLLMMRGVLSAEVGESRRVFSTVLGPVGTRHRRWVDPSWVSAREVGLLSTALAADPTATGADLRLPTVEHLTAALSALRLPHRHQER